MSLRFAYLGLAQPMAPNNCSLRNLGSCIASSGPQQPGDVSNQSSCHSLSWMQQKLKASSKVQNSPMTGMKSGLFAPMGLNSSSVGKRWGEVQKRDKPRATAPAKNKGFCFATSRELNGQSVKLLPVRTDRACHVNAKGSCFNG